MKILTGLSAIILLFVLFLWLPRVVKEYRLSRSEQFVVVTIARLPDCSLGYKNKFVHIRYNNTIHVIRTSCKLVSDYSVGQHVSMLHQPGTEIFLFKGQDTVIELISAIIIAAGAITCLIIGLAKK